MKYYIYNLSKYKTRYRRKPKMIKTGLMIQASFRPFYIDNFGNFINVDNFIDMEVSGEMYDALESGRKTVEGRKNSKTWSNVWPGSILRIRKKQDPRRFHFAMVIAIRLYNGKDPLYNYLISEEVAKVLPGVATTITEGVLTYTQWWTPAEIKQTGIKAIEVVRLIQRYKTV